jgi:hypothetical protein
MKQFPLIAILLLAAADGHAATYYVATNGSDAGAGTSNAPFATPQKAMTVLATGDYIYVRGGTYQLTSQVKTSKAGVASNYSRLWAYPGEHPIFDFSSDPTSGDRGIYLSKDYWHVKGIEVQFAKDNGIIITSGSNIVEGCTIHDCNDDGLTLGSTTTLAHDNLILNCDSYRNYQAGSSGNNGDGYSGKSGCGPSNIFQGCRAWYNSDDGWDFYDNDTNTVVLLNCWSFDNGTNLWNVSGFSGNGNGFKLGGSGTHARHTLKQCVAFDNHAKGFDYNLSVAGHTMLNCTSFRNGKPNYEFPITPANGTNTFKNCVSYAGAGVDIVAGSVMISNSWQGFAVSVADFVSLDASLAFAPRNADFSLPTNGFARLAAGSQLIDKGVDVGLPFNGTAPDLGAYEFTGGGTQGPISFVGAPVPLIFSNSSVRLRVTGLTSHGPVVLNTSSNLVDWIPVLTNPAVTGETEFLDGSASNSPARFYRVEER